MAFSLVLGVMKNGILCVSSHLHPLPAVRTALSLPFFFLLSLCTVAFTINNATLACLLGLVLHATSICDSLLTIRREGAGTEGELG